MKTLIVLLLSSLLVSSAQGVLITADPVSREVVVRGTTVFTVGTVAAQNLQYQWAKNGSPIANATKSSLTLASITTDAAGSYTVSVSNGVITETSNPATLQVFVMPPRTFAGLTTVGMPLYISLKLTTNGIYTGKLNVDGNGIDVSGRFSGRTVTNDLNRARLGKPHLQFVLTYVDDMIICDLYDTNSFRFAGPATMTRAANSSNLGTSMDKYTMALIFPPHTVVSYGNAEVETNGLATISGILPTRTNFTGNGRLLTNGMIPFFAPISFITPTRFDYENNVPVSNREYFSYAMGTIDTSNSTASVFWVSPIQGIFGGVVNMPLFPFTPPTANQSVLSNNVSPMWRAMGSLQTMAGSSTFADWALCQTNNNFAFYDNTRLRMKGSLLPGSGRFVGSIYNPSTKTDVAVQGVLMREPFGLPRISCMFKQSDNFYGTIVLYNMQQWFPPF